MSFFLILSVVFVSWRSLVFAATKYTSSTILDYDIVICGGSLSALAAAITAANVSIHRRLVGADGAPLRIALLEPTDWAGGQLTASNVPPDFGEENHVPENLPRSFVQLLQAVGGASWSDNPGQCWVSYKCFEAQLAADYITAWLQTFSPALTVFYNTVVVDSELVDGRVAQVSAVRRTAQSAAAAFEHRLSEDLLDWYSPEPSERFPQKELLVFRSPRAVVEATEFADVLMTSGYAGTRQGVEAPQETSEATDATCGQSAVLPFHVSFAPAETKDPAEDLRFPAGSDGPFSLGSLSWDEAWTYRRVRATGPTDDNDDNDDDNNEERVFANETSNQNLDNDYKDGYLFDTDIDIEDRRRSWAGGVNLTVLRAAEDRSFGFYRFLLSSANQSGSADVSAEHLWLNTTQVGTLHGLAKLPYLRDTRRASRGLDGFRLLYRHLSDPANNTNTDNSTDTRTAERFADTVGIGVYHYADIHALHASVCAYPAYVSCCAHPVLPFYLPFRALTAAGLHNLLLAGKTMAQSFLANAATRLHPVEWASGVAAGAAATGLASGAWPSVGDVYRRHLHELQALLRSPEVDSPLDWTLPA